MAQIKKVDIEKKRRKINKFRISGNTSNYKPSHGDAFYFKLILTNEHFKGARSEELLKKFHGVFYNTCKDFIKVLNIF